MSLNFLTCERLQRKIHLRFQKGRGVNTRGDYFTEHDFPITASVASTAHPTYSRPLRVNPDSNDTPPPRPLGAFASANDDCHCASTSRRPSTSAHELCDMWIYERTLVFCRYVFCRPDMHVLHHTLLRPQFRMLRLCRPKLRICLHLHRLQHQEYICGRVLVPTRRRLLLVRVFYSRPFVKIGNMTLTPVFGFTAGPKYRTVKQLCSTARNTPPRELIPFSRTLVGLKRAPPSQHSNIPRKVQRGIALRLQARRHQQRRNLLIRSTKQTPQSSHQQPRQQQQYQPLPLPKDYLKAPKSASESALGSLPL
jgi:hypothetical protein